ncbi:hypothetical protein CDL12_09005 [Handroanthus impetiginosus]|uniref:Phytocyanin domain-containing protein n=1 Tax=Handroanthus impetiginosus TaxID=429701 RepID=A0A2G9HLF5_9LAMI|nr:hypothetical protein CDL12_09005 [Handroanthus impetiginosus]
MDIINQSYLFLILVFLSAVMCSSHAYQFIVGGKDGWVLNPSENYNHWAERLRFQVNDTLLFKYKRESDSVLVVSKDNYDNCNTKRPILRLDDGKSVFKFERSGPFFFISGNKSNCINGQKLIIVVLAVRNRPSSPWSPPPNAPSPAAPPNGSSPSPAPQGEALTPASYPSPPATVHGPSTNSTPGSNTAADGGHPPPPPHRSFAAPAACINSFILVSTVSFVSSVCLGGVITSL